MNFSLADSLADCPIIAAAKNDEGLEQALSSDSPMVFLLYGSVCSVAGQTRPGGRPPARCPLSTRISSTACPPGRWRWTLSPAQTAAAGIISTKPALIRRARELGLCAVQRFFVLDSIALENLKRQLENTRPDSIEILPGVMPKVIRRITGFARVPGHRRRPYQR